MNVKEALAVVRMEHKDDLIWNALEYKGKWYFVYTRGKSYSPYMGGASALEVDNTGCHPFPQYWDFLAYDKEFIAAFKKRIPVDVWKGELITAPDA